MEKAPRDFLLPASRATPQRACRPPASLAGLGLPLARPSHAPFTNLWITAILATAQHTISPFLSLISGVAQPASPACCLCWPHTYENQLALPSGRARATLESVNSCVKQPVLTQSSPYPLPQPPCWSQLQTNWPPSRHVLLGLC